VGGAGAIYFSVLTGRENQDAILYGLPGIALLLAWESLLDIPGNSGGLAGVLYIYGTAMADTGGLSAILSEEKDPAIFSFAGAVCRGRAAAGAFFGRIFLAVFGTQPIRQYNTDSNSRHIRRSRGLVSDSNGKRAGR
jgi:hypothetical protein